MSDRTRKLFIEDGVWVQESTMSFRYGNYLPKCYPMGTRHIGFTCLFVDSLDFLRLMDRGIEVSFSVMVPD